MPRVTQHTDSRTEIGTQLWLALKLSSQLSPPAAAWAAVAAHPRATEMQLEVGNQITFGHRPGRVPQVVLHSLAKLRPDPGLDAGVQK